MIRYDSIRYLLALAVTKKYRIEQMDAITAYLQSDLCEEIFMEQPDAYTDGTQRVCKLNKAIYGLKQASRQWNQKLDEALKKRGFRKSIADPCIYFSNDLSIIIAIYVDDFLIFYRHINDLNQTKDFLHSVFKMKDLGEARSCLGMKIHQHNDGIDIDQSTYIEDILKRFGMQDCKPMGTPSDTSQKLSANMVNEENDLTGKIAYREAVGSLIHLANCTRPDIAFAVNNVSRFNAKHGTEHWGAVKRIFRYLKGTINLKLRFRNDNIGQLYAFCDSDWASDPDKRRSCSGFTVQMANAAISWHSHLQEIVALSSTEAEYIALSECVKQVLWLRKLTNELNPTHDATIIRMDNESSIKLSKNDAFSARSKHIDVRYHHTRELIDRNVIMIEFVATAKNTADLLTKAVPKCKTDFCTAKMGLSQ